MSSEDTTKTTETKTTPAPAATTPAPTLEIQFERVKSLFQRPKGNPSNYVGSHFILGYREDGWRFSVLNDWGKWVDNKLATNFEPHETPEAAIQDFLDYVAERKIDVAALTE